MGGGCITLFFSIHLKYFTIEKSMAYVRWQHFQRSDECIFKAHVILLFSVSLSIYKYFWSTSKLHNMLPVSGQLQNFQTDVRTMSKPLVETYNSSRQMCIKRRWYGWLGLEWAEIDENLLKDFYGTTALQCSSLWLCFPLRLSLGHTGAFGYLPLLFLHDIYLFTK